MKTRSSRDAGFTLVEIMIVVAIIGLLGTIVAQSYSHARIEVQKKVCIANLRQIEGAIQRYALETNSDPGQAVTFQDIRGYFDNPVICPAGGTSFADSYQITTVDAKPTCLRQSATHKLPIGVEQSQL